MQFSELTIIEIAVDLTTITHGDTATLYFLELLKVLLVSIIGFLHSNAKVTCIKPFQIPSYKNTFAKFERKKSEVNNRKCI